MTRPFDPNERPSWRKPVGILALLIAVALYAAMAVTLVEPISRWPVLAQVPVYLLLGVGWLLPLRRFLIWMETGHWG